MNERMQTPTIPAFFAVIPVKVLRDKRLQPVEKLLYAEITSMLDARGYCHTSYEEFAQLYDCSSRTIARYVKSLKECGYVTVDDRGIYAGRRMF